MRGLEANQFLFFFFFISLFSTHPCTHTNTSLTHSKVQSAVLEPPHPLMGPCVGYTNGLQNPMNVGGYVSVVARVISYFVFTASQQGEQRKIT